MSTIPTLIDRASTIFLEGATGNKIFSGFDILLFGPDFYSSQNSLTCYMSGRYEPTGIGYMPLYLLGVSGSIHNSIEFFIKGFGDSGGFNLFTKGVFSDSEYPLVGGSGLNGYMPMYMVGTGTAASIPSSSTITPGSGYFNLYTYGLIPNTSGYFNMFVKGAGGDNDSINLYINGVSGLVTNSFNMYTKGYVYNTSGLHLFVRGY